MTSHHHVQIISRTLGLDLVKPVALHPYKKFGTFAPLIQTACIHALALDPMLYVMSQEMVMLMHQFSPSVLESYRAAYARDIPADVVEYGAYIADLMQRSAHDAPPPAPSVDGLETNGFVVDTYILMRAALLAACAAIDPASSILREICSAFDTRVVKINRDAPRLSLDTLLELELDSHAPPPRVIVVDAATRLYGMEKAQEKVMVHGHAYRMSHTIIDYTDVHDHLRVKASGAHKQYLDTTTKGAGCTFLVRT
jgi:hypothetical protein